MVWCSQFWLNFRQHLTICTDSRCSRLWNPLPFGNDFYRHTCLSCFSQCRHAVVSIVSQPIAQPGNRNAFLWKSANQLHFEWSFQFSRWTLWVIKMLHGGWFSAGGVLKVRRSIAIDSITFKMELSVKYLQSSFGRKRNNHSTCQLFSQDTDITSRSLSNRSTSTTKRTSPMILRASFNGLIVECYLFCLAMVCRSIVRDSTVCMPTAFASKITIYFIVIIGPLVLNIMTSNSFTTSASPGMVSMAVEQY